GAVAWTRFEGGTRLLGVSLDCGTTVQIRTNHAQCHLPGERVHIAIDPGHALSLFPASQAG
ncbi:MAG: ABC transporter ATP-binding protein, partial [Halorhodospira sp.]